MRVASGRIHSHVCLSKEQLERNVNSGKQPGQLRVRERSLNYQPMHVRVERSYGQDDAQSPHICTNVYGELL